MKVGKNRRPERVVSDALGSRGRKRVDRMKAYRLAGFFPTEKGRGRSRPEIRQFPEDITLAYFDAVTQYKQSRFAVGYATLNRLVLFRFSEIGTSKSAKIGTTGQRFPAVRSQGRDRK